MSSETERCLDVLNRAKGLIEQGWTQRANARDSCGKECAYYAESACYFCLVGAFNRAFYEKGIDDFRIRAEIFSAVLERLEFPATWNDAPNRKKEDVIELLDSLSVQIKQGGEAL